MTVRIAFESLIQNHLVRVADVPFTLLITKGVVLYKLQFTVESGRHHHEISNCGAE